MGISLRFPQSVEIRNPRAVLLYYGIQFLMVVTIGLWLAFSQPWQVIRPLGNDMHGNMWVHPAHDPKVAARMQDVALRQSSLDLCTRGLYDYWWDPEQVWAWTNHSCLIPCMPGRSVQGCIDPDITYIDRQSEVFIATHLKESYVDHQQGISSMMSHMGGTSIQGGEMSQNYFIPIATAFDIGLIFYYDMPEPSWDGTFQRHHTHSRRITAYSTTNINTVILDHHGRHVRVIGPSAEIRLSVPEMLELAGDANVLDRVAVKGGRNHKPNAAITEGPITWLSGMQLFVHAECFEEMKRRDDQQMITCYLSVQRTPLVWSSERIDEKLLSGGRLSHQYHGLRIKFVGGGYTWRFTLTNWFNTFTTILVLFSVPQRIVMFILQYLLGHLSVVYRKVICQPFSLKDCVGGMAMRLMVANAAFVELANKKMADGSWGISKTRMHERIKAVLRQRSSDLDDKEVNSVSDYCFQAVVDKELRVRARFVTALLDVTQEVGLNSGRDLTGTQAGPCIIDSDSFSTACTRNEPISFNSVVALFDQDRKKWFLERLFTPSHFKLGLDDVEEPTPPKTRVQRLSGVVQHRLSGVIQHLMSEPPWPGLPKSPRSPSSPTQPPAGRDSSNTLAEAINSDSSDDFTAGKSTSTRFETPLEEEREGRRRLFKSLRLTTQELSKLKSQHRETLARLESAEEKIGSLEVAQRTLRESQQTIMEEQQKKASQAAETEETARRDLQELHEGAQKWHQEILEQTQSGLKSLQESICRLDEENADVRSRLAAATDLEQVNRSPLRAATACTRRDSSRTPLDTVGPVAVRSTFPPAQTASDPGADNTSKPSERGRVQQRTSSDELFTSRWLATLSPTAFEGRDSSTSRQRQRNGTTEAKSASENDTFEV